MTRKASLWWRGPRRWALSAVCLVGFLIASAEHGRADGYLSAVVAQTYSSLSAELIYDPRLVTERQLGLARMWLDQGELNAARKLLSQIDSRELATDHQVQLWELQTSLSIQQGDVATALSSLSQLVECDRKLHSRQMTQDISVRKLRRQIARKERELKSRRAAVTAAEENARTVEPVAATARAQAAVSRMSRHATVIAALVVMVSLVTVFRGRTTRRLAERLRNQQQILNAELQHVVETQTASLRREMESRRQLQIALHHKQRHEAIGKLTGGVAHDFNNLLTAILNATVSLRKQLATRDNRKSIESLQAIDEAAKSGAEIVQALLAYARQQSLRATSVDLGEYVQETRGLFRSVLGDGIELAIANELNEGTSILVDRSQLTTSLMNLLTNARDACQGNGNVILALDHFSKDGPTSDASSDLPAGPYVRIRVQDHGCGMTAEALGRAFEPFFSSKELHSGTGLGLSVVYGFVKQSDGDVQIKSSPDGTVVTLLFPATDGPTITKEPNDAVVEGHGELVLVVDDNDIVRHATANLLCASGLKVCESANAAEAIQLIESGTIPDIVLTDVVMPGECDGIGLGRWLRKRHPQVRVVLCSGHGLEHLDADLGVVWKPYTTRELLAALLVPPS